MQHRAAGALRRRLVGRMGTAGTVRGVPAGGAATLALALGLVACFQVQPALRQGTPTSAEVSYAGEIQQSLPIAQRHCASFERTARLMDTGDGVAYYACERR